MTDPRGDDSFRATASLEGRFNAAVSIPLYTAGKWQGLLFVLWPEPHPFTPLERNVFTALRQTASALVTSRRAYLDEEAAREEANLLYEMSSLINAAPNEQALVDAVMQYVAPPEVAGVGLIIWENYDFDTATTGKTLGDAVRIGQALPTGRTIKIRDFPLTAVMDHRTVSFVEDVQNDPRIDPVSAVNYTKRDVHSIVLSPLTSGERWMGVLTLFSNVPRRPSDREVRMLRALSRQMTTVVERFQFQRQTEQRARELETVARVSAATASLLDVDQLLASVVELTKESFDLYHAHVYLGDDASEWLTLAAGAGEAGQIMKAAGRRIAISNTSSLVARAGRERQGVIVNDVTSVPDFLPNRFLPDTRAELAVPMLVGDKLIGVLDVQSETVGRFKTEDVQIKTALADQIAVAVENAHAFTRLRQQEAELQAALKQVHDMTFALDEAAIVAITDPAGKMEYVNDKYCEISQYSRAELLGQSQRILDSSYHSEAFIRNIRQTIGSGQVWHGELRDHAKDGSVYWVDTTVVPILDEQGKPRQNISIRYDITARKQAEQDVQLYADIVQVMPTGVYVWQLADLADDHSLTLRTANQATIQATGFDSSGFIGRPMSESFPN